MPVTSRARGGDPLDRPGTRASSPAVVAPVEGDRVAIELTQLSQALWHQRQLLDLLVYKLEVQRLVLSTGRSGWLSTAHREVEEVLESMHLAELARAVQVAAVARTFGLSATPTLGEIVEVAPPPWGEIFAEHLRAFLSLTAELEDLTRHNRELLHRGYQATREFLASVSAETDPEGYHGAAGAAPVPYRTSNHHTLERGI